MNVNVIGHHLDVTPAIHQYVIRQLARIYRHFDHIIGVTVKLSVEKLDQRAEVTLHMRGRDLHAEASDEDLYSAIDKLADKLDRQVLKHKQKLQEHQHLAAKRMHEELVSSL